MLKTGRYTQTFAGTAARFLQSAINSLDGINLAVDSKIGTKTIEAVNKLERQKCYDQIIGQRMKRYEQIIAKNPSQAKFKNSWFSRIKPFETSAADNVA